jgi:hypothetical protein
MVLPAQTMQISVCRDIWPAWCGQHKLILLDSMLKQQGLRACHECKDTCGPCLRQIMHASVYIGKCMDYVTSVVTELLSVDDVTSGESQRR